MHNTLRGQFMLASRHLRDSNFFRTVVLLLEHNEQGAMGVIVNRPSSVNVAHALAGHFEVPNSADVIYVGGPVEPSALSMLHNIPAWGERELSVLPGVFVGNSAQAFEEIVGTGEAMSPTSSYRVYSGYAGWGAGQLEQEIERGDWFTLESTADFVFNSDPYDVWENLLGEFHKQNRILPIPAEKAEWN